MYSATATKRSLATQSQTDSLLLTPAQVKALPPATTRILDVTWFMPNSPRNAREEFNQLRIPGAKYMDLDEVASEHPLGLKHMMPSPQQFKQACENLGVVSRQHTVVLYDTHGIFSAPRALFMFKAFGHTEAFVMNGGLPAWREEGLPLQGLDLGTADSHSAGDSASQDQISGYPLTEMQSGVIRSFQDMLTNTSLDSKSAELVLDARPNARFTGIAPEPRSGLASGHMKHSISIPFGALLATHETTRGPKGTYTTLSSRDELRQSLVNLLNESGRDGEEVLERILQGEQSVVASCGSGMTAAVIWIALQELGVKKGVALYDESWTGWASRPGAPILTGDGSSEGVEHS